MPLLRVNNIKCRFTISKFLIRKAVERIGELEEFVSTKRSGNIISLKTGSCAFIIFTNGCINVTGINNLKGVRKCVDLFFLIFSIWEERKKVRVIIDNISASGSIGKRFTAGLENLKKLTFEETPKISFNQELFPGITIKFTFGCVILFLSGRVNVVGVKKECLLPQIENIVALIAAL